MDDPSTEKNEMQIHSTFSCQQAPLHVSSRKSSVQSYYQNSMMTLEDSHSRFISLFQLQTWIAMSNSLCLCQDAFPALTDILVLRSQPPQQVVCLSSQAAEEDKTPQVCWHFFISSPHSTCWVNLDIASMDKGLVPHSRCPLWPCPRVQTMKQDQESTSLNLLPPFFTK